MSKDLTRYQCNKCKEYFRGGAENKTCPLCGGTLVFKEIGVKE
jgi:rRNA maturation endonuclease Nob1